jgi:murein DD-endopeptidase MepM/ murein hydrolase activator NlpD
MLLLLALAVLLAGCAPNQSYIILVTATPPSQGSIDGTGGNPDGTGQPVPGQSPSAVPTPMFIPTPDPTRTAVVDPTQNQVHVVQRGDTLAVIARWYGVTVEAIVAANNLPDEDVLSVGQALVIPTSAYSTGLSFKIIPDSELVFGPALAGFDTAQLVQRYPNSFLANYSEQINDRLWSGAEIIDRVALEQSINPRLLLALLEYQSQWLSQRTVSGDAALYPMGYIEQPDRVYGLYRQLDWAGKMLQTGYYGWRLRGLSATLLADGGRVGLDPTINAGTAGVQVLLAQTRTLPDWLAATGSGGMYATYTSLFGDPFSHAVEPLIPPDLEQPPMSVPWDTAETWYFTGGAHGGWGSSSAWAALDFVPSDTVDIGCTPSDEWARAVADGVIARSEYGIVVLDLDGDGFEGTGWTVFYLHLTSAGRAVVEGQRVSKGDPIGYPECEGGVSYATHLHIARRYNGEWIPVDCTDCLASIPAPQLDFDGWLGYSFGSEYDGSLVRGEDYREACTCRAPYNTFGPADFTD